MSALCICAFQYGSILARFLLLYTTMTKSDLRGKDFSVTPPDAEGVDPILVGAQAGAGRVHAAFWLVFICLP